MNSLNKALVATSLMMSSSSNNSIKKEEPVKEFKYSDKLLLDLMLMMIKSNRSVYISIFKEINKIKDKSSDYINIFFKEKIKYYWGIDNDENLYFKLLSKHEVGKRNLPFDKDLIKPFFNCYPVINENGKIIKYNFEIPISKNEYEDNIFEIIYESKRAKEKNAWQDFIKNWWYNEKNRDKRIECYMDVYNAVVKAENNPEIMKELEKQEKTE